MFNFKVINLKIRNYEYFPVFFLNFAADISLFKEGYCQ